MQEQPNLHLWLIPMLPLMGAVINGLLGNRLKFSNTVVSGIALFFTGAAFGLALYDASLFLNAGANPVHEIHRAWIQVGDLTVNFAFLLDRLSLIMLFVVTGVGFLIHIYSVGYMSHEGGYYRFFAYLNLFMFFMLVLILASNFLLLFVGWEGVGLASYLLIGFYFTKDSAANAGKKAFIVNRIGDFAFLIGMFLIVYNFHSLDYAVVLGENGAKILAGMGPDVSVTICTAIALCLMIGATGKSAQIPLYVWLPDAMEGPTPVSALIHAATMVTAGIYMTARASLFFNNAPVAQVTVAIIGAATAIFAASIGITQFDIKRVLAYSTVSQLGYMFMACGVTAYSAAIFHLMTHAFFKALLFLSAGSVIHALGGEQDMRNMGGLRKCIPWTFGVMFVGTIAIAGIPPFAGFFSKDEILWQTFNYSVGGKFLWVVGLVTAFMTSFYMFRMLFMTFLGERRESAHGHDDHGSSHGHDDHGHGGVHESPWIMLAPLVLLAALSIFGGWAWKPLIFTGENKFETFLKPVMEANSKEQIKYEAPTAISKTSEMAVAETHGTAGHEAESGMELWLTGASVSAGILGWWLAWMLYVKNPERPKSIAASIPRLYHLAYNKYFVDELYARAIVQPLVEGSTDLLWKGVDTEVIDAGVNGVGWSAQRVGHYVRRLQSGNIRSYGAWVALGAVAVIAYMLWMGTQ